MSRGYFLLLRRCRDLRVPPTLLSYFILRRGSLAGERNQGLSLFSNLIFDSSAADRGYPKYDKHSNSIATIPLPECSRNVKARTLAEWQQTDTKGSISFQQATNANLLREVLGQYFPQLFRTQMNRIR